MAIFGQMMEWVILEIYGLSLGIKIHPKTSRCMIQSEMDFGSVGIVGILHQFRNSQGRTRQLPCCLTEPTDSASHLSETFAHGGPWSLVFFSLATFVNESLERFAEAFDDADD